ncbi:ABC transporter substrate-binding protein [Allopusillimonas soli]|uniref:ABC transporter substrate-binding protein n=1 Tax=Allopusillimonas soli TaxID=659016 RepID=A0A853FBK6_9BURK|nr:ABC transporter substrate-binding protein [Allopusillimonas soli]NYT37148.1 ABC transporter substrate-binding protein [Allopusillimonas soli]TEA75573.1 ABC transporter substrate-binding protein [Allopusillimonas soli]
MNRRNLLKLGGLAALATPLPFKAVFAAEPAILLGAPNPMSGPFAANGKFAEMGMKLFVEETKAVLGRPLAYRVLDTQGKPAIAVRQVQDLFEQQHARFFAGGILSSGALAMGKSLAKQGGIFVTTAGADEITGSDCNKATFRWSVPTYGAIRQTIGPLIERLPDAKRWYTITPQYVFGEGLLSATKDILKEHGLEHVGNSYHSLDEREFSGYLTNAMAAKPDVLVLLNFGSQSSETLRQAVSFGIKNQATILLAWASGLEQFESLGADLCQDVYFGVQYWHTIDSPLNHNLVEQTQAMYNRMPNYSLAGSYIIAKMIVDGIAKAADADPAKVIAAMEGTVYDGLTGSETIRKQDHQVIKNYYLLKGKPKDQMKDKDDYCEIIQGGQSFLDPEQAGCKMPA